MIINIILTKLGLNKILCPSLSYKDWITEIEQPAYKNKMALETSSETTISIVLIVSSPMKRDLLEKTIFSVVNQLSPNWELLILVSDDVFINSVEDERIKIIQKDSELKYFEKANEVTKLAHGDLITFISEGDILSISAVSWIIKCKDENNKAKIIYTDEDYLDANENR